MLKTGIENTNPDHYSMKTRKPKSREVSSRFLSPTSASAVVQDVQEDFLTLKRKKSSTTNVTVSDAKKNNQKGSQEERESVLTHRLWPSTSSSRTDTLPKYIGKPCLEGIIIGKNHDLHEKLESLSRQKSCKEYSKVGNDDKQGSKKSKENHIQHKGVFGGSMRYSRNVFSKKSSSKTSSYDDSPSNSVDDILPRRISISENNLHRRSLVGNSEPDFSGCYLNSPQNVPKKGGKEISSRSMSFDQSTKNKKSPNLKRASTMMTVFGSTTSKWAMSPGRSGSPPMIVENKGVPPMSFSSLKPPTSPSKKNSTKGVGSLLSKGLDLIKGKGKTRVSFPSPSPLGTDTIDSVHQLRINYNRVLQWRYANVKANKVNKIIADQAESYLIAGWDTVTELKHSVVQKKIRLEKEKLQMKLYYVLKSQVELLKACGEFERQHTSAVATTTDCLHSVICKVPLVEGAKMDTHSSLFAVRHAYDLTTSIKSMLCTKSPEVEKTNIVCSELVEVVAQEKALLEEFSKLFELVSTLEEEERSLKCSMIQMKTHQQQMEMKKQIRGGMSATDKVEHDGNVAKWHVTSMR